MAHRALMAHRAGLLLALLSALAAAAGSSSSPAGSQPAAAAAADCRGLLQQFYSFNAKEAAPLAPENLVYFLHIPRTAGRTFHSCLLRLGTPGRRRCPKAYDHLRIDFALPQCHLLSSHDDFSVVEQLPANTAVVTQLRDPVDRLLSAYEFAIEVAARQLRRSKNYVKPKGRVVTDDVWPWSYLVPFFVDDIKPKVAAAKAEPLMPPGVWSEQRSDEGKLYYFNKLLNISKWSLSEDEQALLAPNLDPYNNRLFMPLSEFAASPIAAELLHNGQLMQVLGLTNYSHWQGAAGLRACMSRDAAVADELLAFALRRIERFTHVGATDKLVHSVEAAAASLSMALDGPAYGAGEAAGANVEATRTLTWQEAMAAGDAPRPIVTDDNYDNAAPAPPDVHQQAGDVRRKRAEVSKLRAAWNEAAQAGQPQSKLRALRSSLNTAKAELVELQGSLVATRTEETKKRRQLEADAANPTDKTLELALGAEFQRCAARAQKRNASRKKNSLLNLRLNDYRQVYFSKEDRAKIPPSVIEELRRLNALDVKLHQRALELLEAKRAVLSGAGQLQALPPVTVSKEHRRHGKDGATVL